MLRLDKANYRGWLAYLCHCLWKQEENQMETAASMLINSKLYSPLRAMDVSFMYVELRR